MKRKKFNYRENAPYLLNFLDFLNNKNGLKTVTVAERSNPTSQKNIWSYKSLESTVINSLEKNLTYGKRLKIKLNLE